MTSRDAVPDLRASLGLYARALEREHPALKGPAHGPDGAERRNPFSECHECALLNDFTNGRLPVAAISSSSATEPEPSELPFGRPSGLDAASATETQDGERPEYEALEARRRDHPTDLEQRIDAFIATHVTCAKCGDEWPCSIHPLSDATPTPDDRDREWGPEDDARVERQREERGSW